MKPEQYVLDKIANENNISWRKVNEKFTEVEINYIILVI